MRPRCPIAPVAALLAVMVVSPGARGAEWQYLSMDGKLATCIVADGLHGRIFVGTVEGFHYFEIADSIWVNRDWEGWIGRQVHSIAWHPVHDQRVVTGRENAFFKGYIELSEDLGVTEQVVYSSPAGAVSDIERDPNTDDLYYACTWPDVTPGEFLRSQDGGASWSALPGAPHYAMTALAIDPTGVVFVAGDQGVARSTDGGLHWQAASGGLPAGLGCYCLTADPGGTVVLPGHLFTSNDAGIYETFTSGDDWTQIHAVACRSISFDHQSGTIVAVTFGDRVLFSRNGGQDWDDETGGLTGIPLVDAVISPYDRAIYLATSGHGVYRTPLAAAGVAGAPPETLRLLAGPNPFRGRARIEFDLGRGERVDLAAYDAAGRRVAVLLSGLLGAGPHVAEWSAADLPSGIYQVRLRAAGESRAVRLIHVR
jgi:hypothetical protein